MKQEIFRKKIENKPSIKVGSEVRILIDGAMNDGWKIKRIFKDGPLSGKILLEKEEKDMWAGKERGIKKRKRIIDLESLEKWNKTLN